MTDFQQALTPAQQDDLLALLHKRFDAHMDRHPGSVWADIQAKLAATPAKLRSLHAMELTGGAPDVIGQDVQTGEYLFVDCAPETPEGRRNLCYDHDAWASRKANKPEGNAMDMAQTMGITILTEEEYRTLQRLGAFDTKTSSWIHTPDAIRSLGGALFGDRRYDHVFIYHNGAESYYAVRGFRGMLRV